MHQFFAFHLVGSSGWPLFMGSAGLLLVSSLLVFFFFVSSGMFLTAIFVTMVGCFLWWRDVSREGVAGGEHSFAVQEGLKWGMALFIFSEVMFFAGFFWTFFHSSVTPVLELGGEWPSWALSPLNPLQVPLLNTLVLLSSGVTVTWAHHLLLQNKPVLLSFIFTVVLGGYFTSLQGSEYLAASFNFSDSVYGSIFYMATGFHGLHVLIGTIFLVVSAYRISLFSLSSGHHLGVEFSIWYWHFVDVVWLYLFTFVYWWGWA